MPAVSPTVYAERDATAPIRVLIVDDSTIARAALAAIVGNAPALVVAGECDTAERALAWLGNNSADVVLLDLDMPGRGGLASLPDLIAAGGGARVIVVSGAAGHGAQASLEALALGAAETIVKPGFGAMGNVFGHGLIKRIERLGSVRVRQTAVPIALRAPVTTPVDLLAVGASTGGIEALAAFLKALPVTFDAPVLVTQHLPPSFMPYLADQLADVSGRPASVAADGERIRRGHILVAPGERHLNVSGLAGYARIALSDTPAPTRCCPSVDSMFASLAPFGAGAAAVVLSGMGRDGVLGAQALALAGGSVVAQDEASSAIWGMPGAVARGGLASLVGPPAALARHVAARGVR